MNDALPTTTAFQGMEENLLNEDQESEESFFIRLKDPLDSAANSLSSPLPVPLSPDSELHIEPDVKSHLAFFMRYCPSPETYPRLSSFFSLFARFMTQNLLPDTLTIRGKQCPPYAIKALKFASVALLWTFLTRQAVVHWGIEHDGNYGLSDFLRFDCHPVLLDLFSFFVVGRLAFRRGVDCVCFLLPLTFGTFFLSWITTYPDTQKSFTMYGLACEWTPITYLTFALVGLVLGTIGLLHVRTGHREGILLGRLAELVVVTTVIVFPVVTSDNFHIHHWYAAWLFGMHINYRHWWSLATMGFTMGVYVNGIGVYGRDSILGCEEDAYRITNDQCGWIDPLVPFREKAFSVGRRRMEENQDWHHCEGSGR